MHKAFWQAVLNADGAVPEGYTAAGLTPELLEYLGSTDPFLRDEVAFEVLAAWITRDGLYAPDELRALGNTLAHNLTIGLGQQNDDSIFLRSFSALVLDKVIEADNWRPSLDEAEIRRWMEQGAGLFRHRARPARLCCRKRDGRTRLPTPQICCGCWHRAVTWVPPTWNASRRNSR